MDMCARRDRVQRSTSLWSVWRIVPAGIALVALALGAHAAAFVAQKPPPLPTGADGEIVARAFDSTLTWKELDVLLVSRRALSKEGREGLQHLAEATLLEKLGKSNGITAPEAQIDAQVKEFESQSIQSGEPGGLEGFLRKARLTREEFKRFLRLAYVQETMTRRALGLKETDKVTGEQQKLWIQDALAERSLEQIPPPWKDDIVARCSEFTISRDEFLHYLRMHLPTDALVEDCYQMLLMKRMRARMPDLAPEKLAKALQEEIQRRRDDTKNDPRYKGIPYESLLSSQGILIEKLEEDPMIQIAALAKLWVDRSYDPASLQRIYKDEREYFDGAFGPAVETYMCFLRGAGFKNELNPRSFAEAEKALTDMKGRIRTLEEFKANAKEKTEDAQTKDAMGALGYLTPMTPKLPPELRGEITKAIATPSSASAEGSIVGPVRLSNGSVLLWFGSRRPAPSWDVMSGHVHRELRRRFVDEVLPRTALITAFAAQ
jgi:hypothetical protein